MDSRGLSSFKLSKLTQLSPTTTRKIYTDQEYIPSPDVLERICLGLQIQPGDILEISSKLELEVMMCSGVLSSGLWVSGSYRRVTLPADTGWTRSGHSDDRRYSEELL